MIAETMFGTSRGPAPRFPDHGDAAVAIASLSWAWAAVAVDTTPSRRGEWTASRWLAPHRSDANLAARLAGQCS
jgi:hypothetical protein